MILHVQDLLQKMLKNLTAFRRIVTKDQLKFCEMTPVLIWGLVCVVQERAHHSLVAFDFNRSHCKIIGEC